MNDKERLDWIHTLKCICCELENERQPERTEAHHLVDKGTREAEALSIDMEPNANCLHELTQNWN